jgi:T5orf172 domain-containing protein
VRTSLPRVQIYPSSEVDQYINDPSVSDDPGITEEQAIRTVEETLDTSDVIRTGEGVSVVYAYGYRCCEDRLKVGFTEANTVQRIAAQITTSTPDKPVLLIEIKTDQRRALERAIQATLETRGRKISGAGAEWFKASRDDVLAIYQFIRAAVLKADLGGNRADCFPALLEFSICGGHGAAMRQIENPGGGRPGLSGGRARGKIRSSRNYLTASLNDRLG